jgi:hypothetical protein
VGQRHRDRDPDSGREQHRSSERDKEKHRSITLRGIVCPSDWGDDNDVSCVSILTFDDDEFEVEPSDAGAYLIEHLRCEVLARGRVVDASRRRKLFRVKSFTVID